MPTAVPVKFLDIFILLSLFNLKNVFYYSFNFHFYSQLLPFKKKKPAFLENKFQVFFSLLQLIIFSIFYIVFLRV